MDHWRITRLRNISQRATTHVLYRTGVLGIARQIKQRKNPGLVVLMYHAIGKNPMIRPALCVSERNFTIQINYVRRHYTIISLPQAADLMARGKPFPQNALAISFDDGYRDNYEKAWPILRRYGCPATIFVSTEPLEKSTSLWQDKLFYWFKTTRMRELRFQSGTDLLSMDLGTEQLRYHALTRIESSACLLSSVERTKFLAKIAEGLGFAEDKEISAERLMVTWDQLLEMTNGGMTVGSHTITHPSLTALSPNEILRELTESKSLLESRLNRQIAFFAYPFGGYEHFNSEIQTLVEKAGYQAACTAINGLNRPTTHRFALRRTYVPDEPAPLFARRLIQVNQTHP